MANKDLTRKDGSPYNIRKVNGVWMFLPEVFGDAAGSVPTEMLLVPQNMTPTTVYPDMKSGYIPEGQILAYIKSKPFATNLSKVTAGSKTAIVSSNALYSAAEAKFKTFDTAGREALFNNSKLSHTQNLTPAATTATTPSRTIPGAPAATGWDAFKGVLDQLKAAHGASAVGLIYDSNNQGTFYSDAGKQQAALIVDLAGGQFKQFTVNNFLKRLETAPENEVRNFQKMLGMPQTGFMTDSLRNTIVSLAMKATERNVSILEMSNGDTTGQKLWTLRDMADMYRKTGGDGTNGTTRSINRVNMSFEDASMLVDDVFQSVLGRNPTASEKKQYANKFKSAAAANPSVSTTVRSGSTATTTTTPGFDSQKEQIRAANALSLTPEAQWVASSTVLYDAFLNAIDNPLV